MWTGYASRSICQDTNNEKTADCRAPERLSMFSGSIPALVTPFAADGAFDEDAYRELVEWQ